MRLTISKTTATGVALAKRVEQASEELMLIKGRWIPEIDGADRVQNQTTTSLGEQRDLVLDQSFRRIPNLPRFPPACESRSHYSLPSHRRCPTHSGQQYGTPYEDCDTHFVELLPDYATVLSSCEGCPPINMVNWCRQVFWSLHSHSLIDR
jgi:hypothetical protein